MRNLLKVYTPFFGCLGLLLGLLFVADGIDRAYGQERNLLDRPKDSQDACGYTLKAGQVKELNPNQSMILVDRDGTPSSLAEEIQRGPVCAFEVDHPDVKNVRVTDYEWKQDNTYAGNSPASGLHYGDHVYWVNVTYDRKSNCDSK